MSKLHENSTLFSPDGGRSPGARPDRSSADRRSVFHDAAKCSMNFFVRGYSEKEVFTSFELGKLGAARDYVARIDEAKIAGIIRCHELVRAVGRLLQLAHEDGVYAAAGSAGGVDHSWLLVPHSSKTSVAGYSILDVYAVGRLPQVQLLHCGLTVPHHASFIPRGERSDVDKVMVLRLMQTMLPMYSKTRFPPRGKPSASVLVRWFPPVAHFQLPGRVSDEVRS